MKKFIGAISLILMIVLVAFAATTPISNGVLQGSLNANNQQILNANFTNALFVSPLLYQVKTNIQASYDASTDYAVDMTVAKTFIAMSTVGQNMSFNYCTNIPTSTNGCNVGFYIKGDGTHTLSFGALAGSKLSLLGPYTTNGVIMGSSNGLWFLAVGYDAIPGIITNTTYALVPPNN